jgi:pimeloyl-ACP methyl ester carboxylesterase
MIAVDGHQFHLLCKGDGTPTAILEPGFGLPSLVWAWVQAEVANTSRVCIYDRAGYGWSEPTAAPMDAENVSRQLYELLKEGNISGPYVLVGHSIGAAYIGMFAMKNPEAAAALILIDPTVPVGLDLSKLGEQSVLTKALSRYFVSVGGARLLLAFGLFNYWRDLPPEEGAAAKALFSNPMHMEATLKERSSLVASIRQLSTLANFGSVPMTVIYSEQVTSLRTAESQKRYWLNFSANSRSIVVRGADHISVLTNREYARQIANVIVSALESLRH